ncbi:alpha/beta hydrolase [Novosphingobium sp.]|uniref:alpha/beta fold hydrolase n=1 Tax=Novosphingobium sp. TaxID=1874826 RepID=UPI002633F03D|nr:alpha/beta hydrolase [Novosphingobium sp.]
MAVLNVGLSQIRYDEYGEGQPVILLHGVGGNRVSWFRQIPYLSARYRVISMDQRAFGLSTDVEGLGRDAFVDDLLALVNHLAIDRALLVGQSMGGGTCAAFACRYPERVAGLVIADSLAGVEVAEPLFSIIAARRAANADLGQIERVLGPDMPARDPELTLLYLQIASFNSVNAKTVRGAPPPWSPERLAETGLPTSFIVGTQDIIFPPEHVREVADQVPGARFTLIPEAGHSAYFEQPAAFNAALDESFAVFAENA